MVNQQLLEKLVERTEWWKLGTVQLSGWAENYFWVETHFGWGLLLDGSRVAGKVL